MIKKLTALILALILCACACAEEIFDGTVYSAYAPSFDESALAGWEIMSYIEPSGLLLSATSERAEISVSLEEAESAPETLVNSYVNNVQRYGTLLSREDTRAYEHPIFEAGARAGYSYRLNRDGGSGTVYYCDVYVLRVSRYFALYVTQTSWNGESARASFNDVFVPSLKLTRADISTTFTAFLKNCEQRADGIYLSIDYCQMEFETDFGMVYAVNDDPTLHTYRLSPDAEIWLPKLGGALYSLQRGSYDAQQLTRSMEEYYSINLVDAIYMVLFDASGDIIRLQHYNAF